MRRLQLAIIAVFLTGAMHLHAEAPVACDIARAMEICDSLPLEGPEGIWIYPEDRVTVLVVRDRVLGASELPAYTVSVVRSDDAGIFPGEVLGSLKASAKTRKYSLTLHTLRKKGKLGSPQTCVATVSSSGDEVILSQAKKKGVKFRFSLNPATLLPRTWRIIRMNMGLSTSSEVEAPSGMVKIYPSYDGNGSSRRAPRYL